MNNPNVLNIQQPNRLTIMVASGTLAVANMLGMGAAKADARVELSSDITCTTVDPVNPGADDCMGNIGNRVVVHTATDYPAVDPYSKRTLYIRPDGIRTALYDLDSEGTLTPGTTQDNLKRTVTWAADGTPLDCQVTPTNGNQADECSTYDGAYGTANIMMSDELTYGTTPTGGGETGGDNGGGDNGGTGGGGGTTPTPTTPGPNWALIETCLNKDADLTRGTKFNRVKFLTRRLGLVQASFKTLEQKDSACAGIDTNRTVRFRILQKRPDGKERAITQWPVIVNSRNDNGRLRTRKAFAGTGTPLCGPKYPYRVVATAKTYTAVKVGNETARVTNTKAKPISTRKLVKPC